jgi:hypothetical protein
MNPLRAIHFGLALVVLGGVAACSSDDSPAEPSDGELVVQARSLQSFGTVVAGQELASQLRGDPTRYDVTFYRFYMAADPDCSDPQLLGTFDSSPVTVDLLTDPTLFTVSGEPGTYECIVMRISDVFTFVSESSFGNCSAGSVYTVDTYRDGQSGWFDVDRNPIAGSGTDASPVDNRVDVFFTTNPAAVEARGYSEFQITPLTNGATIPGTSTFVYDVTGQVVDDGTACRSAGGTYGFR